jgi:hypothetical protein
MVKYIIILLNMLGVILGNILFPSDVTLQLRAPNEVNAGSEFQIEVTLKKRGPESFARFQQELPRGLTAQVVDNSNASFAFDNQSVKFIWLRLPAEDELKITYKIKVDERLKGSFSLDGLFSYIDGNDRKSVKLDAKQITIRPSQTVNPNQIVDISEFQQMVPYQPPVSLLASNVKCIRQAPLFSGEGNDLMINILVNRGSADKFAKVEEDIPPGYTAEAINTRDAIFTFKDQKAKFLWMNLPKEPRFVINYRLSPLDGTGTQNIPIKGTFSFILNEVTQVIDIIQRDVDLSNLDPRNLDGIIASAPAPSFITPTPTGLVPTSSTYTGADGGKDIPVEFQKIEEKRPRTSQPRVELDISYMLEPEDGVYYRVQIAAGHRLVDIKRYFRRLSITEDVRTERHEGWYKYSIGSFGQYKLARDRRNEIWTTTPIDDAFVAAYNNGIRITVQEALMITNQQWYK